jgi:hypothetical protein
MQSVNGEEMTFIDPATMPLLYHLSQGECHAVATGACSLEKERPADPAEMGEGEAHWDYCNNMLKWMRGEIADRQPFEEFCRRDTIEIGAHNCGHYSFNGGQHRTCIAQRKGMKVYAIVEPAGDDCDNCKPKNPDNDDVILITPPF